MKMEPYFADEENIWNKWDWDEMDWMTGDILSYALSLNIQEENWERRGRGRYLSRREKAAILLMENPDMLNWKDGISYGQLQRAMNILENCFEHLDVRDWGDEE